MARTSVRESKAALRASIHDRIWRELTSRYPRRELRRLAAMFDVWLGGAEPRLLENQQRKGLFMPDLATTPWLDTALFSFVPTVERAYERLKRELDPLLARRRFVVYGVKGPDDQYRKKIDGWRELSVRSEDERNDEYCRMCPSTARLAAFVLRKAGMLPEFNYLMLKPGTVLPPHVDAMNFLVTIQMGMIVPSGCTLTVANVTRAPVVGKCFAFDNSFLHTAQNMGKRERILLSMHVPHPELTATETAALSFLFPVLYDLV